MQNVKLPKVNLFQTILSEMKKIILNFVANDETSS